MEFKLKKLHFSYSKWKGMLNKKSSKFRMQKKTHKKSAKSIQQNYPPQKA